MADKPVRVTDEWLRERVGTIRSTMKLMADNPVSAAGSMLYASAFEELLERRQASRDGEDEQHMTRRRVTWEHVSAIGHPEYYRGDNPCVSASAVPDAHWTSMERIGEDIQLQATGLRQLVREGELVRNVQEWEAPDDAWTVVKSSTALVPATMEGETV